MPKAILKKLINKHPKSFRKISYQIICFLNFLSYFLILPLKIIFLLKIISLRKFNLQKIIIRNDRIGDSILTLPFLYGTTDDETHFFISEILEEITSKLKLISKWKSSEKILENKHLLIGNLATAKKSEFKNILPKSKSKLIFTQLSTNPFAPCGFPLVFSPFYSSNKSQTRFLKNCFNILGIKSEPVIGIKLINSHLERKFKCKETNSLIIVLGLGVDSGRQINKYLIKGIINNAKKRNLVPYILEEPNNVVISKELAKENNIKTKSCKNLLELFILLKNSKYVIGYDCGPMHIASLVSNSITLFSHASANHWGKHIWNKTISKKIFHKREDQIFVIKQKNKGSLKNNWLIYKDEGCCPFHRNSCINNKCSELNNYLLVKSINLILSD